MQKTVTAMIHRNKHGSQFVPKGHSDPKGDVHIAGSKKHTCVKCEVCRTDAADGSKEHLS